MRIIWQRDVELNCVDEMDEWDKCFKKGDISSIDIIETYANSVDIEFDDGSMCYAVPKEWFNRV